jgi:hypothetical protein
MEPLVCIEKTNAIAMSLRIIDSVHILAEPGEKGQSSKVDEDGNETQAFIETIDAVPESWKVTVLVRFYDASCKVVESTMVLLFFTTQTDYDALLKKPTTQDQINVLYTKVRDKYNFIYTTNTFIYRTNPNNDIFNYKQLTHDNLNVYQLCKDGKKTLYYLSVRR